VADFAVIGDPVGHSRSPRMHQAAYDALKLPYRYVAVHVGRGSVGKALDRLAALGYRGVNVTVPHKEEALAWAAQADELSRRIGAANTLRLATKEATNTDAGGFLDTIQGLAGREATMLGAGGTARALAAVLPGAGYQVRVWNRTRERAMALADEFGLSVLEEPTVDADLVVNTTSAGLHGDRLPLDWSEARNGTVAYDLVYGETPFLTEAAARGLRTIDGQSLLVAQGARSFEWWLGLTPSREAMAEAIR